MVVVVTVVMCLSARGCFGDREDRAGVDGCGRNGAVRSSFSPHPLPLPPLSRSLTPLSPTFSATTARATQMNNATLHTLVVAVKAHQRKERHQALADGADKLPDGLLVCAPKTKKEMSRLIRSIQGQTGCATKVSSL